MVNERTGGCKVARTFKSDQHTGCAEGKRVFKARNYRTGCNAPHEYYGELCAPALLKNSAGAFHSVPGFTRSPCYPPAKPLHRKKA